MQNNIKHVWKTSRKRSAVVSHLLPYTYKLVLYLTKTKLYNTNCYWRKGCYHRFGSTAVYFPATLCKKLFFWATIHQKELTSSLRKKYTLWDSCPDSRASLPPSGTKLWPTLYWLLKKSFCACPYAAWLFSRTVGAFQCPQRKFLSAKFRYSNWAHRISLWKAAEALSSLQQGNVEWELLFQWTPLLNV